VPRRAAYEALTSPTFLERKVGAGLYWSLVADFERLELQVCAPRPPCGGWCLPTGSWVARAPRLGGMANIVGLPKKNTPPFPRNCRCGWGGGQ